MRKRIGQRGGVALGGQDNVIVHPVPQDIFTQTAQGRKVKKDQKPSKGGTKVQVRMH